MVDFRQRIGVVVALRIFVAVLGIAAVAWPAAAQDEPKAESKSHAAAEPAADHSAEGGHESPPNPLDFKTDLAIWTFFVFLLILFILWKFAWGPISQALDKREHNIADNIAAAQRAQDDAKEMLAQYEKKLAGAADQVREMLDEARRDAEHTKQQIVAEAKTAAQAEHDRALRDIRTATDAAVKELSERSTDLAIELAGKVISAKLSPDERSRLVQDSLSRFAATTPSQN